MFAYIKSVMWDIKGKVADVLEGLEQSRRWDLLKALEAQLEGLDQAVAKLEADVHIAESKAVTREQAITDELEQARARIAELEGLVAAKDQALEVSQSVAAEG